MADPLSPPSCGGSPDSWHPAKRPNQLPSQLIEAVPALKDAQDSCVDSMTCDDSQSLVVIQDKNESRGQEVVNEQQHDNDEEAIRIEAHGSIYRAAIETPALPGKASFQSIDSQPIKVIKSPDIAFRSKDDTRQNDILVQSEDASGIQQTAVAAQERMEMDQAWRSEIESQDPQHAASLKRTNSFPDVPPLEKLEGSLAEPFSQPQAETTEADTKAISPSYLVGSPELRSDLNASHGLKEDPEVLAGEDFIGTGTSMGTIYQDQGSVNMGDDEARYEEGLPLVAAESPPDLETIDAMRAPDSIACVSQPSKAAGETLEEAVASSSKPRAPDRKDTTQVIHTMKFETHNRLKNTPRASEDQILTRESAESSLPTEGVIDRGVTLSPHEGEPQSLPTQEGTSLDSGPTDEDLADMWKAALSDDFLLEDADVSLDPAAFFEDDGEGFLDDDPAGATQSNSVTTAGQGNILSDRWPSQDAIGELQDSTGVGLGQRDYGSEHLSSVSNRDQPRARTGVHQDRSAGMKSSVSVPNGFGRSETRPYVMGQSVVPQNLVPTSTQSFADKSKGGYTSPYDLPPEVAQPKKRNVRQQYGRTAAAANSTARPPPPRSSSMYTGSVPPSTLPSSQPSWKAPYSGSDSTIPAIPAIPIARPSSGAFFEELPSSKTRPVHNVGRYTPSAQAIPAQSTTPPTQYLSNQQSVQPTSPMQQTYQLLPPERMGLYSSAPPQHPSNQTMPIPGSRYSPASGPLSGMPPPRNRYASSPFAVAQTSPSQSIPFQPRTSSPLARSTSVSGEIELAKGGSLSDRTDLDERQTSDNSRPSGPKQPSQTHQVQNNSTVGIEQHLRGHSPLHPDVRYVSSDSTSSSSQAINTPETDRPLSDNVGNHMSNFVSPIDDAGRNHRDPLQRSQTQPPIADESFSWASFKVPSNSQRSVSVSDRHQSTFDRETAGSASRRASSGVQRPSQVIDYIRPADGREHDGLERWRGCPLLAFGFGGSIVTSFPQHVPRYSSGQQFPMLKCSPGEVKVRSLKSLMLEEDVMAFPGPLKSKHKKKEVLEWLQQKIVKLEHFDISIQTRGPLPDLYKCHEEKILLWKVMKILVESDGDVDGNANLEQAVGRIMSPELNQKDAQTLPENSGSPAISAMSRPNGSNGISEVTGPEAIEGLRKLLLHGEREKAIWHAVDNRMWPHAMLLSSTLDQSIWRQVASEFVRQEVRSSGNNTEPLAALYQMFSGNGEESMDELVPPSARAGLQMISKNTSGGPTKNALDGLDKWRETLTLILSNRSSDDGRALVSLGQLLAGYGRVEAAHICYLFAKTPSLFGPPDDPQVRVALVGTDHLRQRFDFDRDMDAILLTEIYEFARIILASSSAGATLPHLQAYKIYHATYLAERGLRSEAQQYCDTIASTLTAKTKSSSYYHSLLFASLESLNERLRQGPKDGSSSWISKPSMDKVSGSLWNKFNQYVAGDDGDTASSGSGMTHESEFGPFAKVAGEIVNTDLGRSPAGADMYGPPASTLGGMPAQSSNPGGSTPRYGPAGAYTPKLPPEQVGRSPYDPQMNRTNFRSLHTQDRYASRPGSSDGSLPAPLISQIKRPVNEAHEDQFAPIPPLHHDHSVGASISYKEDSASSGQDWLPPLSQTIPGEAQMFAPNYDDQSSLDAREKSGTQAYGASSYQPQAYEPVVMGGYEPPSYEPPDLEDESSMVDHSGREKQKSAPMLDDGEDDLEARAEAIRKAEKARKDREADDAFRKAAEEDAQKDNAPKLAYKKSGWFGAWLGSSKEKAEVMQQDQQQQQQGNKPIKVKLGEEKSSFYFDKEKGKWVNPKANPDDEKPQTPPPPPPRGPPSRAVSGTNGPPIPSRGPSPMPPMPTDVSGYPKALNSGLQHRMTSNPGSDYASRSATPAIAEVEQASYFNPSVGSDIAGATTPGYPPSAPPSRPATAQGGAIGIDDLLGASGQRKAGTVRKTKKGRGYVDVMAK